MIRDAKMMQLVAPDKEPITPFVQVVRALYTERQVSTILVVGGSGDFLDVADHVLLLDTYHCQDATARAKEIVVEHNSASVSSPLGNSPRPRYLQASALVPNGKVKTTSKSTVLYGETELRLGALEQLVCTAQTNAIATGLKTLAATTNSGHPILLSDALLQLNHRINEQGLECLAPSEMHGQLARPRILEFAGAINRLRRQSCVFQNEEAEHVVKKKRGS